MYIKIFTIVSLLAFSAAATGQPQPDTNRIDNNGMKQGYWIKRYPNGNTMYEGLFQNDHPVGEFRRYYETDSLRSVLIYSHNGDTTDAVFYHPNGYIASEGRYIKQIKEGRWNFFSESEKGYLICEEDYSDNIRNGVSIKYYPDRTVAERLEFINGKREGEWLMFYPNGKMLLKSYFSNDLRNGKYEIWDEDGIIKISGCYKNNLREGSWFFYNKDKTVRYKIDYVAGNTDDHQKDIDATNLINEIEQKNKDIPDPEKTGEIR